MLSGAILVSCGRAGIVERIAITNDTSYIVRVEVSGPKGGWLTLTTVLPRSTEEVQEVIDQGPTWNFRFAYAGYEPVERSVSRSDLADAGWRVEVPIELDQKLRRAGIPPPPE